MSFSGFCGDLKVSIAATKFSNLWKINNMVYLASYFHNIVLHRRKSQIETQTGYQPRGRSWGRGHGEVLLYWLAPHNLLSLLSYSTLDHKPRDGTNHNDLPTSTTHKENAFQACPQYCDHLEASFQLTFTPISWFWCQVDMNPAHPAWGWVFSSPWATLPNSSCLICSMPLASAFLPGDTP